MIRFLWYSTLTPGSPEVIGYEEVILGQGWLLYSLSTVETYIHSYGFFCDPILNYAVNLYTCFSQDINNKQTVIDNEGVVMMVIMMLVITEKLMNIALS